MDLSHRRHARVAERMVMSFVDQPSAKKRKWRWKGLADEHDDDDDEHGLGDEEKEDSDRQRTFPTQPNRIHAKVT